MIKILLVIGTRPELIKVAPIVHAFKSSGKGNLIKILSTAQHKDMLEKYWDIFDIRPDYELNFLKKGQSLGELTGRAFTQTDAFFARLEKENNRPEYVLVQGDTTTVFSVGLSAFYRGIKVAHIEAGLRTYDIHNPFPEEFNRRAVSIFAEINFAPTTLSAEALRKEGVDDNKIKIVGNTVVDAIKYIASEHLFKLNKFDHPELNNKNLKNKHVILITFHRRENQNDNLHQLIASINILALKYKNLEFIWTVHPNPKIKNIVYGSDITKNKNVTLVPPLEYMDLLKLMKLAKIILSDSGGIQEEAPTFGVPVMVLREKTERPEGIFSGKAFLTPVEKHTIINKFDDLYKNYQSNSFDNPYGDGMSAVRIKNYLLNS